MRKSVMRLLSVVLVLVMLIALMPSRTMAKVASVSETVDSYNYTYKVTDDGYSVCVETYSPGKILINVTTVYRQSGRIEVVDSENNIQLTNIDEYVSVVDNPNMVNYPNSNTGIAPASVDYEPVTDDGLTDSVYGDGYKFIGSVGMYYYDESGYLFRKIDSMIKHEEHRFTFSAGTAIGTAVGVVLSVMTGGGLTSSIVIGLLGSGAGTLVDGFIGTFDCRTYNYLYKVRILTEEAMNTYRNITYWVSYEDKTETLRFEQKSFNGGYSPSNYFMVKAAIDEYLVQHPID